MRTGLFFGSFNPIHIGHLIIANHIVNNTDIDQIWLVLSPCNPFKKKNSLLDDHHRLALIREAIVYNNSIKVSNIEFDLPQPSYTINTLTHLEEGYPDRNFVLLMGEDNLRNFHRWKNYEQILSQYKIMVYPRVKTEKEEVAKPEIAGHPNIQKCDAPIMEISATMIRNAIKEGKDYRYYVTDPVWKYIDEMNFYK